MTMNFSKPLLAITVIMIGFATAAHAGDKEDVMAAIDKRWKEVRAKSIGAGFSNPDGVWMATSQGGLWQFLSPVEAAAMITQAATTMEVDPLHVNIQMLGSSGDVAYATYYLVGNIRQNGKIVVSDYRTRTSEVYVKVDGSWITSGSHYSPLFGGSGVVFE